MVLLDLGVVLVVFIGLWCLLGASDQELADYEKNAKDDNFKS